MSYSYKIPLTATPSQSVQVLLDGQSCVISVRTMGDRLYLSLSKDGVVICRNVLLQNRTPIVRAAYSGFTGELAIVDTQGDEPPTYDGLGSRWLLLFNPDA